MLNEDGSRNRGRELFEVSSDEEVNDEAAHVSMAVGTVEAVSEVDPYLSCPIASCNNVKMVTVKTFRREFRQYFARQFKIIRVLNEEPEESGFQFSEIQNIYNDIFHNNSCEYADNEENETPENTDLHFDDFGLEGKEDEENYEFEEESLDFVGMLYDGAEMLLVRLIIAENDIERATHTMEKLLLSFTTTNYKQIVNEISDIINNSNISRDDLAIIKRRLADIEQIELSKHKEKQRNKFQRDKIHTVHLNQHMNDINTTNHKIPRKRKFKRRKQKTESIVVNVSSNKLTRAEESL
ncbi:unnamed protein product [Mytilus edulis]|uniref:Uncharacterized protein n=1 Tax=Mytilus edulis TaxID=6550 RepID=A0A8S3RYV1_MYTED|nr:unnamed protein product [Mytilus edulis]